jgi:hypothetical protein
MDELGVHADPMNIQGVHEWMALNKLTKFHSFMVWIHQLVLQVHVRVLSFHLTLELGDQGWS